MIRNVNLQYRSGAAAPLGDRVKALVALLFAWSLASAGLPTTAQTTATPPALGAPGLSCVISAVNRNAVIEPDGRFTIFDIPSLTGAFRGRATCTDGSVGQTPVVFTSITSGNVLTGDIVWGKIDPVPTALGLSSALKRLTTGSTAQLTATAIGVDEASNTPRQYDVTPRSAGTTYAISNDLMGTVTENGLVTILPLFASGSTSRVVLNASAEGGATGSYMFILGPRGVLRGRVLAADGVTPIANAQVSVLRTQPREAAGTIVSDASGNWVLPEVNAGAFQITAIDSATGDRAIVATKIENEGEEKTVELKMNGQGTVEVTVVAVTGSAPNEVLTPVPNSTVTLTALGGLIDTRTAQTDSNGKVRFERVAVGEFTVSTRDRASGLVGTALGLSRVGTVTPLSLRLQPVGTIQGVVYDVDGSTAREGIQVRVISRERGIVTQGVTDANGAFSFSPLPLSDGPFTLDAFADGRLRARVPGLVLNQANQVLPQNITLGAVGTVRGVVLDANRVPVSDAIVTLQMNEGQRFAYDTKSRADGSFVLPAVLIGAYTVTAGKDSKSGRANGTLAADGETQYVEIQLAGATVTGIVYERDGATPVGAGTRVYLVPANVANVLTVNALVAQSQGIGSTLTDAQGRYILGIPATGRFVIQVERSDDRGRAELAASTVNPSQPYQVNVTFLAKGTVSGIVKDPGGAIQANTPVAVTVRGAFDNTWTVVTDSAGRYGVPGVFVGEVTAVATNATTRLAGSANGRMLTEAQALTLDITLAATGTLRGQITKRSGAVVAGSTQLELKLYGGTIATQTVANGNAYEFTLVPTTGDVSVVATEVATGDKGISTTRIETANQVKTLNVRMVGQGTVAVRTVDEAGNAIANARVTVATQTPFSTRTELRTDATGNVSFPKIFAGDFSVSASVDAIIGTRSGSANDTLLPDTTKNLSITLTSRPTGKIRGIVFQADGVTPKAGVLVRMTPEPQPLAYSARTDAQGKYEFSNIEGGSKYTLQVRNFDDGFCNRDRIRGQVTGVTITQQDEIVERNIQMFAAGSLRGKTLTASAQPVGGIKLTLTNPDPTYGANGTIACRTTTTYGETSAGDGTYNFGDIPGGDFTIVAENGNRTLRAEGRSRVRFDGDAREMDLTMIDSAVTMPYTLHDANAIPFDITGDGSIASGKNNLFTGTGSDTRGLRLAIVTSGIPVPFLNGNGTIGRLTEGGQQLEVDEANASGLKVTRKVYVPRTGYFARYLEVLENNTTNPITVGVRVTTHHSQGNSNPRVVDSSDGDQVLSVIDPVNRDRWIVVDDQEDTDPFKSGSQPATGHLYDGTGASKQVATADYELIGQTGKFSLQWDNVTVPAGKKVLLMHFTFSQLDRYKARQAALRLAQLPPEAIENLSTDEREAIANFAVPANGISTVEQLPTVDAGSITGRVVSGDGTTPIAKARVHLKSQSPLYARDYYVEADNEGKFELRAKTDGTANAIAIPLFAFDLDAQHPKTYAGTGNAVGDFVAPAITVEKNLIFNNTGNLRGTVKRHGGALVDGAYVSICPTSDPSCTSTPRNWDNSKADGTYLLAGSPPRDYFVYAEKSHPQGGRPIFGKANATISSGDTAVVDITLEQTGTLAGVVRAANGDPVQNAIVDLAFKNDEAYYYYPHRTTRTDTAGRYRFFDVRVGDIEMRVRDSVSGATGEGVATVAVDSESTLDITLRGFGTLNIQVNYARGVPATQSSVSYQSGSIFGSASSDTNGRVSANVSVGTYSVRASHPDDGLNPNLVGESTATIAAQGNIVNVTVTLKATGVVRGTIVRPDGTTFAGGFPYKVAPINSPLARVREDRTDGVGAYRMAGLPIGSYILTAYDPAQDRFADEEFAVTADGQEVALNLSLEDNRIALPATLKDANRFPYDVAQNGSLPNGMASSGNAFQGAAQLEVNGVTYNGDTSALLEAGRRQFAITQPALINGLKVTRKVFVPRGGYFARYLEVFENPTASAINVDAKVTHGYPAASTIVTSSSGDSALQLADNWLTIDDTNDGDPLLAPQQTSTAVVYGQTAAGTRVSQASFADATSSGSAAPNKAATLWWPTLTVPPNGKVALMHFVVQQIHQAGAKAAAERLVQLPPEALQSLTASEIASIRNFAVPQDATSTVTPLPSLTSGVNGRVFEGDARTGVANVRVTVQSTHPLFNRTWGRQPDPTWQCYGIPGTSLGGATVNLTSGQQQAGLISSTPTTIPGATALPLGSYGVTGQLTNDDSVAIPQGVPTIVRAQEATPCFGWYSGHSWTRLASPVYTVEPTAQQNVIFPSGILTGTITGYNDFSVTGGRMYLSTDNPDYPDYRYIPIASDGTYVYPGLPPGTYDVLADTQHPQSYYRDLRASRSGSVVTLANTTVTDVQLQPAGSLQGAILTQNGEASVNALVEIRSEPAQQLYDQCASNCVAETLDMHKGKRAVARYTRTDSLGRYNFAALPIGVYNVTVTDPISDGQKKVTVTITENQSVVQNITLLGLGSINLTVTKAGGAPLVDAYVYIKPEAQVNEEVAGRTNAQGRLTIANVPTGAYVIRIPDSRAPNYDTKFEVKYTGAMTTNGESQNVTVAMRTRATLNITVRNADTNQPQPNVAIYELRPDKTEVYFAYTNASGVATRDDVVDGNLRLIARVSPRYRAYVTNVAVTTTNDDGTVSATINSTDAVDQIGELTFNGERRLYRVAAVAGQKLSIRVDGESRVPVQALSVPRVTVYNSANEVVADGYRYYNYGYNYNVVGDLSNIVAADANGFTIALRSEVTGDSALGAYRVMADADSVATQVASWNGATISGTVTRANGAPATNRLVEIDATGVPGLRVRTMTDASGNYTVAGIPVGSAAVKGLTSTGALMVSQTTSVPNENATVTQNLVLPAVSPLIVTVKRADGSTVPANSQVDVTDATGTVNLRTDAIGQIALEIVGTASVKAYDPSNYLSTTTRTIAAQDATSLTLELQFGQDAGRVSGRVLNADGTPASASLELRRVDGTRFFGYRYSDGAGNFEYTNVFDYNVPLRLLTYHYDQDRYITYDFTLPDGSGKADIEIRLPAGGSITGKVVNGSGMALSGAYACAGYDRGINDGYPGQRCTITANNGSYEITNVPVGIPLTLFARVFSGQNSTRVDSAPFETTLANATIPLTAPDLVLGKH